MNYTARQRPSPVERATVPRYSVPPLRGRREAQQWEADALLLLVTLIWGSTFVLVQQAVERSPVFVFLCLRFVLATLVLCLLFGRRLRALSPRMLAAGVVIGLFLFAGYAFQTVGLQYTSSSKAGFITGLSVVIVPILSALLLKRVPERQALLGVVLATVGLVLLTLGRDLTPARGDLIVLGCAFCYALHITAVSLFAPQTDALALTIVQIAVVAVASGVAAMLGGDLGQLPTRLVLPPAFFAGDVLGAAAFTGVLGTALAFAVQNSVQSWTTATHTALIFAAEPVFAGLFGYWLAGDRLTSWGLVGCALILLGMLVAELRPHQSRNENLTAEYAASAESLDRNSALSAVSAVTEEPSSGESGLPG
jgi:drug/metabolite transporter (DMT)-like permease